jgi:hypothetical protein
LRAAVSDVVTVIVLFRVKRPDGSLVPRAIVRTKLTEIETDEGFVVPALFEGTADDAAELLLPMWPNARGSNGSRYSVAMYDPVTQMPIATGHITVPDVDVSLQPVRADLLLDRAPYPSLDAAQQATRQLQQAQVTIDAAVQEATDQAGVATAVLNDPAFQAVAAALDNIAIVAADKAQVDAVAQIADDVATLAVVADEVVALVPHVNEISALAPHVDDLATTALNMPAILAAPGAAAGAAASDADATAQALNANTFALSAAAQAAQAYAWSLSSASAQQQDLSAIAKQLHYSPNAILGTLFYDTGKDSNPAWVDQVANASYMQEALNGTWLDASPYTNGITSELIARSIGGTLGPELAQDSGFNSAVGSGLVGGAAIAGGFLTLAAAANSRDELTLTSGTKAGHVYEITLVVSAVGGSGQSMSIQLTGSGGWNQNAYTAPNVSVGTIRVRYSPANDAPTATCLRVINTTGTASITIDSFSIKEVTTLPAATGSYFQNSTDGKHYTLNAGAGVTQTTNGNSNKPPRIWAMVWESGYLCIYDPTKPGCPLWKAWLTTGVSTALGAFTFATLTTNGVWAKEGKLYIGSNQGGLICDFANDKMTPMRAIAGGCMLADRRIAARNAQPVAGLTNVGVSGIDYINLGNNLTTCITGTTYGDAPVDPNTLLMQPTVFLGAGTTCTLLKDDGTAVTTNAMGGSVTYATMTPWYLLTANGAGQGAFFTLGNLRTVATNWPVSTWSPNSSQFTGDAAANLLACSRSLVAKLITGPSLQGPSLGLMRLNASNQLASLFAKITPYSNTGWMVGDIRGCWLSSTVSGATVAGVNIITDSTFDSPATSALYFNQDGNISHSVGSGVLNVSTNINAGSSYVAYVAATEPGVQYTINAVFSVVAGCTGGFFDVRDGASHGSGGQLNLTGNVNAGSAATGAASTTFTAVSTLTSIRMVMVKTQNDASCTWDNHTCTVTALADRSYKANNLTLTGSLTKSAANAATQIMLYGGWSAANYARQAYSANLDPATGALRGTIWGTVPQAISGASAPAPGGYGPLANYLNPALFASSAIPPNFTTQWARGTGWSTPSNTTATSNGSQTGNSDLTWNAGGQPTIGAGNVRVWTINVSAINGTLVVYANNNINFNITAPGTYYGFSNAALPTAILRAAAGTTVSLTLGVQELLPAMAFHRAGAAGASYGLGINALAQLVAFCNDGTTNRMVTAQAPSSTSQAMLIKAAMEYATSGTVSLRINSAPAQSTTGAPLGTLSNAAAVLTVGADYGLTAGWPGGLALLRIGMTNATQEQSALCFEHEYMMFQPGAVCALPDAAVLQDFSFDPSQQKLKSVSSGYESSLIGLTFAAQAAASAGSFTRCAHQGGMKMLARSTTNPGVDILVPAYALREELANRDRAAAERARLTQCLDYTGGFTAQTFNGNTLMTNVAGWTYPSQTNPRGEVVTGSGIPAGAAITEVTGNIVYLSAAATAGNSGVQIALTDFSLPAGYEATDVFAGGGQKVEGATKDYARLFDGFRETIRFSAAPGYATQVHVNARRYPQ